MSCCQRSARSGLWLALLACVSIAAPAQARSRPKPEAAPRVPQKRVVVAPFQAATDSRARSAVLEMLSEHEDVEVVGYEDVVMTGRRFQADPADPAGRRKLSEELGIDVWMEGTIGDDSARVSLHTPDGRNLAVATLQGQRPRLIEGLIGERVWAAMGVWLSEREHKKRAIETQQELAQKKVRAREQELVRQRQLVQTRAGQRVDRLKAAQRLAREKRDAFEAEVEKQRTLVAERAARAERENQVVERRRQAAEKAELVASHQQSGGSASPWAQAEEAPAPAMASGGSSVWTASAATATPPNAAPAAVQVWAAEPSPAAAAAPGAAEGANGLSPATQLWLAQQGGQVPAVSAPGYATATPPAVAAPLAPATPSAPAAPSTAAAPPASAGPSTGLSPATRRWLEQQQQTR